MTKEKLRAELSITDELCDRLVELTMETVAANHGIQACDLNPSITEHRALGRSIVRAGYDACAAQSADLEKVAAAAQADNVRLREAFSQFVEAVPGDVIGKKFAVKALAHPLDTYALDAYVAKKTAAKIDDLPEAVIDSPRYFLQGLELGITHCAAMREHLTRCGCEIDYLPKWFLDDSTSYITKAGKAIIIYAMIAHASLPPSSDKQGE